MAKLTKQEEKLHAEALALVDLERDLTLPEREFVLEHFQEASTATNSTHGAFFTPEGLANDFSIEVPDYATRIIDLGAGIGRLSFGCRNVFGNHWNGDPLREFVCIERNPEYARIGRKVLPEATWIVGDILDVPDMGLGRFDAAIGNPPFGAIKRTKDAPGGYKGRKFEYHVIAVAAAVADYGVFIIPQNSAPFTYSGRDFYEHHGGDREYQKFHKATGIALEANCGIDTAYYRDEWHGVSPVCEIVTVDFTERATGTAAEPSTVGQATLGLGEAA
ncbi:methyltransferase [Nocardia asiatica]|uniref:methyltransferase n=1 Tax=Nocardia asiatica TaxID=209252 RepID=UPI002455DF2F|nr:methyltransferase [Nocardia asiatica]